MIRTSCPKCGREDAVADYLASLPIMCNGCGTRVTIGERIVQRPPFPPPAPKVEAPPPPPPPPPKAVAPPPPPPPRPKPKPAPQPIAEAKAAPPVPVEPPVELESVVVSSPLSVAAGFAGSPPPVAPPAEVQVPDELVKALDEVVPVPVPPTARVVKPATVEPPFPLPLAGVGRRLLARFLFLLGLAMMVGLGFGVLIFGGSAFKRDLSKDSLLAPAVLAVFPIIYLLVNAAMLARTGQDVGKRYAGIRVVNADGSKATEKTALLKRDALTFVIGLTGVGLLYWLADFVTLFGKGGRTLHDRIAGTRVVRA